jgi:hypothetical protein
MWLYHVYCNEDVKDRLWLCKVQIKFETWVNGADRPLAIRSLCDFFGFNSYFWIWRDFNFDLVKELEKNPIELKMEVKVCQVVEKR